jgi:hypothetical protein
MFKVVMSPSSSPSPSSAPAVLWRQADDDVYVASADAEYAGFVAATPRGFEAHGGRGQRLGVFPMLDRAKSAVVAAGRRPAGRRSRSAAFEHSVSPALRAPRTHP